MHTEVEVVKVPQMAESITEGTLKQWQKKVGDYVEQDEEVATIETDKVRRFTLLSHLCLTLACCLGALLSWSAMHRLTCLSMQQLQERLLNSS